MEDQLTVPEWDLADRLRKALRQAGMDQHEMAAYLEVSRNTINNWVHGRNTPKAAAVRLWAMRTGVPYEWLRDGAEHMVRRPGFRLRSRLGLAVAA